MIIELTKTEKTELLKAVIDGNLNLDRVPRISEAFLKTDPFLELMIEASQIESE